MQWQPIGGRLTWMSTKGRGRAVSWEVAPRFSPCSCARDGFLLRLIKAL